MHVKHAVVRYLTSQSVSVLSTRSHGLLNFASEVGLSQHTGYHTNIEHMRKRRREREREGERIKFGSESAYGSHIIL